MTFVPLQIGVCGLSYGLYNMDRLQRSDEGRFVRIRALCDAQPARLASGVARFGCPGYASLDQMLAAEPEIEAVALFTPPAGRAELVGQLIRAGKHVMTTKPLELDPAAALRVLHEARLLDKVVFLNSPAPVLGDDLRQILAWQREFNLGQLIFMQSDCWYWGQQRPDGTWYDDPARCPAAPILRLGIYGINDVLPLADELVELHVNLARVRNLRPMPDVGQLSLRFASGAMACIRATWCCEPIRDNQVSEFVFEHGTIRRDYSTRDHRNAPETKLELEAVDGQGLVRKTAVIRNTQVNSAYRWDLFHACIRGEPVPDLLSPEQTVAGVRVIGAMVEALANGGVWRREQTARPAGIVKAGG